MGNGGRFPNKEFRQKLNQATEPALIRAGEKMMAKDLRIAFLEQAILLSF
ncbi:MAG: hypothetical protein AAGA73_04300 [Pseudomonadota bacterium]